MGCHNFINLHDNNLIQITARQKHHIRPTIKCIHCNFRHKHQKELVSNRINLKKGKICEEFSIYYLCNIATNRVEHNCGIDVLCVVIRLFIELFPYNLEYKPIYGILYLP